MRLTYLATAFFGLAAFVLIGSLPAPGADDPFGGNIARTDPLSPAEQQKKFHLPPGFEIQLVAAEPEIRKPINLSFDDRGRIWVTDSVEYPIPAPKERKGRDSVKVLEDTNGDGRADKVITFAEGLNIPIGVLPIRNGCIAYSIPNIHRLLDTNGDDVADQRDVFYQTFGFADTHGMANSFTWGLDGWIYACHGFHNTSTVKGADGKEVRMQSGNTYRFKPDGSHIEQFTFGQVNPFGLCFDPLGNLYSADCHSRPAYQLLHGAHYPSFGKPHDGLGFGPELMTHDHGSTAICGIVYYDADHFPRAYRDTLFIGNVVTNRINHDRLERHGASYRAIQQPDFLTCDDPWFRPVDIKLGPDGALYIADFYNRIIGHYEVPITHPGRDRERGRIWRVVYRGTDGKNRAVQPRADWSRATVSEMVDDLGHANLAVRTTATNQIVERGGVPAVVAIKKVMQAESRPMQRVHGLWVLERLRALDDRTLEAATHDKESSVRVHAQRVLAERRDLPAAQRKLVLAGLKDADPFVQRAAAEALGLHPAAENVRPLLDLRHAVGKEDTHLLHVVRMALRNQLRPGENWEKLQTKDWTGADFRDLADVAPGIPSAEAAGYLLRHIEDRTEPLNRLARYVHHVARYGTEETVPKVLAFSRKEGDDLGRHATLFRAIHQGTQERGANLSAPARRWAEELTSRLLASGRNEEIQSGIELAGAVKIEGTQDTLVSMAHNQALPQPGRLAALRSLAAIQPAGHLPLFGKVLGDAAEAQSLREQVSNLLAGINSPLAREELVKNLLTAPAPLQRSIALGLAGSPQGAVKLLEAVAAGKASARLLQEPPVRQRLEQARIPDLKEKLAKLTIGLPPPDERFQKLMGQRRKGFQTATTDAQKGAKVYEKNCAICHQLGGKGTKIGPQLDGIGARGLERLLEDVLDPNRNVDQAFRSTSFELKNGQVVAGLLLRAKGEVLIVADGQGKEVRVAKSSIQERTVSQLSPMPANQSDQIDEADFYDLLAYLLAQKVTR